MDFYSRRVHRSVASITNLHFWNYHLSTWNVNKHNIRWHFDEFKEVHSSESIRTPVNITKTKLSTRKKRIDKYRIKHENSNITKQREKNAKKRQTTEKTLITRWLTRRRSEEKGESCWSWSLRWFAHVSSPPTMKRNHGLTMWISCVIFCWH